MRKSKVPGLPKITTNSYTTMCVNSEQATTILYDNGYGDNRDLNKPRMKRFANDMKKGDWDITLGAPITIGVLPRGKMIILNGHHRLETIASHIGDDLSIELRFIGEKCSNMEDFKKKYDFFDCGESSRLTKDCLSGSEGFALNGRFQHVKDTTIKALVLTKFPKAYLQYHNALTKPVPAAVRAASTFRDQETYIAQNHGFLSFLLKNINYANLETKINRPMSLDSSILSAYTDNSEIISLFYLLYTDCGRKGKQFITLLFDRAFQMSLSPDHIVHRFTGRFEDMGNTKKGRGHDRSKGIMFLLINLWNMWYTDPDSEVGSRSFPKPKHNEGGILALPIAGSKNAKESISNWRKSLAGK